MSNADLTQMILNFLKVINVKDIIVCAGARNLPFLTQLNQNQFQIKSYFEERSAGFYAMGLAQATSAPVVIITTSGTAVAELLPCVIESYYQSIPIIVITADRPKSFRGTGSPQTIDQSFIFKNYVESFYDWDVFETNHKVNFSFTKPIHFNICFDEPLIDTLTVMNKKIDFTTELSIFVAKYNLSIFEIDLPLVIISKINRSQQDQVIDFLENKKIFHIAEAQSGLIGHSALKDFQINSIEAFMDQFFNDGFKSVIRIGGVPTNRVWRDLESKLQHVDVFNFTDTEFTGLSRFAQTGKINDLQKLKINNQYKKMSELNSRRIKLEKTKSDLLLEYKSSEPGFINQLSQLIQQNPIYIGNSLPIREWDLFSSTSQSTDFLSQPVFANRGANGIDGQISTYLGWARQFKYSWCVVGDLTTLYDLAALGLSQANNGYRIVIINNSGGQIFNRMFKQVDIKDKYLNPQNVQFSSWAEMWNWNYLKINSDIDLQQLENLNSENTIIEIAPDPIQTQKFWLDWEQACQNNRSE